MSYKWINKRSAPKTEYKEPNIDHNEINRLYQLHNSNMYIPQPNFTEDIIYKYLKSADTKSIKHFIGDAIAQNPNIILNKALNIHSKQILNRTFQLYSPFEYPHLKLAIANYMD